jgi:hypothetical protein
MLPCTAPCFLRKLLFVLTFRMWVMFKVIGEVIGKGAAAEVHKVRCFFSFFFFFCFLSFCVLSVGLLLTLFCHDALTN